MTEQNGQLSEDPNEQLKIFRLSVDVNENDEIMIYSRIVHAESGELSDGRVSKMNLSSATRLAIELLNACQEVHRRHAIKIETIAGKRTVDVVSGKH